MGAEVGTKESMDVNDPESLLDDTDTTIGSFSIDVDVAYPHCVRTLSKDPIETVSTPSFEMSG